MRYAWVTALLLLVASPAMGAQVYTCGFEPGEGYSPGPLNGQQGWYADVDTAVEDVTAIGGT